MRSRQPSAGDDDVLARPAAAAAAAVAAPGDPADVGQWEATKVPFPITAIHAAMLSTGKVLFFTYPLGENSAQAWLWDPANDPDGTALVRKDPPLVNGKPANIWCAGQTFAANGELVVFGGNLEFPLGNPATTTWKGLDRIYTFDPVSETWTEQPKMRHGRWYPTGIRMADGRIPILSGLDESGNLPSQTNPEIEVFTPSATAGGQGTISYVGNIGGSGPPYGGLYPHMFAMPSGRTLIAGPAAEDSWFLTGVDQNPFGWSQAPNLTRPRSWGTTVPLPAGPGGSTQVMALGGTDWTETPSTPTTEVFDENNVAAGWKPAKSNVIGRGHANTVLLPDGSMVEVGGGVGKLDSFQSPLHAANPEQRQIELWDPATGDWQLGPAQTESRAYHSTALLLPDGRVMSAGDEFNGDGSTEHADTAETYKPPYLFRGPRPTITSNLTDIKVGAAFGVNTPNTNIRRAALVAPAAVTHGVDMNQRVIQLDVIRRSGCVSITAPSANVAPPGPYMLFLLDDQGVPSVADFVKLQTAVTPPACTGPALPIDATAPTVSITSPAAGTTVSGPVTVKASAHDNDVVVGVQFKDGAVNLGAEDTRPPFSAQWDSAKSANGSHTLTAVARDAAGNTAPASVQVTANNLDTTPPSVALTSPGQNAKVSGPITLTALAGDDGGLRDVQFMVDDQKIGEAVPAVPSSTYSKAWNSTDVTDGTHALRAVATDDAGLSATSAPVTVSVDNPDPPPTDSVPPIPQPRTQPPTDVPPAGNPGGPGPTPANLKPAITRVKLSRATFRKGVGVELSFRLSEAATVSVTFERRLNGRRVRGRCVKLAAGKRPNCTRYAPAKTVKLRAKAGASSWLLRARLFRSLAVGRYRLTLLATDATGKRSAAARASFRLLESAGTSGVSAVRAAVLGWF
jgi:hypothetical protein